VLLVPFGVPRADRVAAWGLRRETPPKALTTQVAAFPLRHGEPPAVFGRSMDRAWIREAFRLRRLPRFRTRGVGVRREMVQHATHVFPMRIRWSNTCAETRRPSTWCPRCRAVRLSLPQAWGKSAHHGGRPLALLRGVIPPWLARERGERRTDFPTPWGRHGLHPAGGRRRRRRLVRDISACGPVPDNGGLVCWRHPPGLLVPRVTGLAFPVRRMGAGDTEAISAHATSFSVRLRQVHRAGPAGAGRPEQALHGASSSPVLLRRGALGTGLRDQAAAKPSSPPRVLRCSTFGVDPSDAEAMAAFVPPQDLSALRQTSAGRMVLRLALCLAILARHAARSVSVQSTASLMAITSP